MNSGLPAVRPHRNLTVDFQRARRYQGLSRTLHVLG